MTEAAIKHLEEKGYQLDLLFSPFVCSALGSDNAFKVALGEGGDTAEKRPPFFVDSSLHDEEKYGMQLTRVIRKVRDSSKDFLKRREKSPETMILRGTGIGEDLEGIHEKTEKEIILFLVGEGTLVSRGRSLGKGVPGTILSAILNPFAIPLYLTFDYSHIFTHAVLINLKTGEILWANYDGDYSVDLTKQQYYMDKWSKNLLDDFPLCAKRE